MIKLKFENRFIPGEMYKLDSTELKFINYEIGYRLDGEAYIRSIFLDIRKNEEKMYDAIGFDFKPLTPGANIIYRSRVKCFREFNEYYSHNSVGFWQKRFDDIIATGLVSEEPFAPTHSQIQPQGDPFELYNKATGIKIWLLYCYGYFIFEK